MTEGENMVERCGLAACVASNCGYTVEGKRVLCDDAEALASLHDGYGKPLYQHRCDCRESARAVIEALMEPTPEMLAAARTAPVPMVFLDSISARQDLDFKSRFQAALRTALSQPNDEGEGK